MTYLMSQPHLKEERSLKQYSTRYSKDLTHLTTFRLSPRLREEAERCADFLGISFSDFLRQSLTRNIHAYSKIEKEAQKAARVMTRNP
jgi:TnpA family transposase